MIRIWFCRSKTLAGRLIRWVTFSRWNHVAVEINGLVYEADMLEGVRTVPVRQFKRMWTDTEARDIDVPDKVAAFRFLQAQLGKPYDRLAILAMPFWRDWQDPDKWFCSEFIARFLVEGGHRDFFIEKHRIWPRDIWIVAPWLITRPA